MVAAGLKYVVEAYEIAFYIGVWIGDAVAHTGLGGQIDDYGKLVAVKEGLDHALVGNGGLYERPFVPAFTGNDLDFFKPGIFDVHIIVIRDGIDADHAYIFNFLKQTLHEIASYEACGSGHEYGLAGQSHIGIKHRTSLLFIFRFQYPGPARPGP